MNKKKSWSFAGLFMVMLVLTLPIYSAQTLAATVAITYNGGQDGIDNYINADADVWTIEATISNIVEETVAENDVKVKLGSREDAFDSCSESGTGGYVCTNVIGLEHGAPEAIHDFTVTYLPTGDDDSGAVNADSSKPLISWKNLKQSGEDIIIDFDVTEMPGFGVGLKTIDILDADSGSVLQSIDFSENYPKNFNYGSDAGYDGILQSSLSGEGARLFRIRAIDRFGHTATSPSKSLDVDFVKPELYEINFTSMGEFIGPFVTVTDLTVKVVEDSEMDESGEVRASSEQIRFPNDLARCVEDPEEDKTWICTWSDVEVDPSGSIQLTVTAEDPSGNTVERSYTKSFTLDDNPPEARFVGTNRVYNEQSYIKNGRTRLIVQTSSSGGTLIANEDVRLDLREIGGGLDVPPDDCGDVDGLFTCYWDVTASGLGNSGAARIGLSEFEDMVGNQGVKTTVDLIVDSGGPVVKNIEFFGYDGQKHDTFKSGDAILIKLEVVEGSGLLVFVDLNEAVMDSEDKFPENYFTEDFDVKDGWQMFTQDDGCEKSSEGIWECNFLTEAVKSGPDSSVALNIKVQDTAGNDAKDQDAWEEVARNMKSGSKGRYTFELLGLEQEESPDYWEAGTPTTVNVPFVDIDTVGLIPARIPFKIPLSSKNAELLEVKLEGCSPTEEGSSPVLMGSFLYDTLSESPKIVLMFDPFDGYSTFGVTLGETREFDLAEVPYTCLLKISSRVGDRAISGMELEEVEIEVPFGLSELGARSHNSQAKVEELKNRVGFQILDKISVVGKIITYVRYFADILNGLFIIENTINIIKGAQEGVRGLPLIGWGVAVGLCKGEVTVQSVIDKTVSGFQDIVTFFSCNPKGGSDMSWYSAWQKMVLTWYNAWTGRGLIGMPAGNLYENIWVSSIGLCVPGVFYNLEKFRQVRCREIICYQNEVPAGLATMDSCRKMGNYLDCRYWLASGFIPMIGMADAIASFFKDTMTNWVGWITTALQVPCFWSCDASNTASMLCTIAGVLYYGIDMWNTIQGAINGWPGDTGDPYCSQIEDIPESEEEAQSTTVADLQGGEEESE